MPELPRDNDGNVVVTGFDIEKILRQAGVPKSFSRAVAAACRAQGLFDRCQADEEVEEFKQSIRNTINLITGGYTK